MSASRGTGRDSAGVQPEGGPVTAAPAMLCGPRVTLRPWRTEDIDAFAAINADLRVMRHFPARLSRDESAQMIERMQARIAERGWGNWALEVEGRLIGFTGLSRPAFEAHFTPCVEIGWRLAFDAWGRGYASEAARLALAHGFSALGLDEIVSFTALANVRSRRVMERIGMTHDPADDFDHPRLDGSPLQRHVLYRLRRASGRP
jgi:RimJ/RimL family protein N-acetyltransferase